MRIIINKKHYTKAERRFAEYLKEMHILFKHRVKVSGREIDFLIGNYAIEIDGHNQDPVKNHQIFQSGYIPIHFNNEEINNNIKIWLGQTFSPQKQVR